MNNSIVDEMIPYSFFQTVIDMLPVAVDIINEEQASVLTNALYKEIFSWENQDSFVDEIEQVFLFKTKIEINNHELKTVSGIKTVHLVIEPIINQANIIGAVVIANDISNIVGLEHQNSLQTEAIESLNTLIDDLREQVKDVSLDVLNQGHNTLIDDTESDNIQDVITYTSRDNSTWMAIRELRSSISKNNITYFYGENGVGKHNILDQLVNKAFKRKVTWYYINDETQITNLKNDLLNDNLKNYQKNNIRHQAIIVGIYLKDNQQIEKIMHLLMAEEIDKLLKENLQKVRWILVAETPIPNEYDIPTIYLPSLKERKSDILLLADKFLADTLALDDDVKYAFLRYDWPDNVRELKSVLKYASTMRGTDDNKIMLHHLPKYFSSNAWSPLLKIMHNSSESMPEIFEKIEKEYIEQVLQKNNNNITHTANKLGVKRQALQYKLKKYNLYIDELIDS